MPEGMLRSAEQFRSAYGETLGAIRSVVTPLSAGAWDLASGCPGWSVRDLVAHVASLESLLIGRDPPAHQPAEYEHVRSPVGAYMEVGVDHRRGWTIERLLADFDDVTSIRLGNLESAGDADMDGEVTGLVFGTTKLRTQLAVRIFDLWSHEQDIRRAVGAPGGFDCAAAAHSRELLIRGAGTKAAQRLAPPDGTVAVVDVTGASAARRAIAFDSGKARVSDGVREAPATTLRLDLNTLAVLGCGRADDPGARDRVAVEGDVELGRRILEDIASTP